MIPEPREFEVHGAARALLLKFRVLAKCQGRRDARGRLWASAEKIAAAAGLEAGLVRGRLVAGVPDLLPRGASWIAVSTVLPQGVVGRVAGGGEEVFARAPAGMKIAPGDELAASKSSFGGWSVHEI